MVTRRLALPGALLSAVLLVAPRLDAAGGSPFGINAHAPQGQNLVTVFDRARDAGIRWVRIDFWWSLVEPAPGVYDFSLYDEIVAAAGARGLSIYATLQSTPAWATDGPPGIGVPRNPADVEDICSRAARRYAGAVAAWGMWNEPNLAQFWAGTRQQYIDSVLKPGADGVHAGDPGAIVGGPDLAHLESNGAAWYRWLSDVIAQAGSRLDVLTHHVYDADSSADVTAKLEASTLFGGSPSLWDYVAPSVREVLANAGWAGRPFWLTETGWPADVLGEDGQAAQVSGLLNDWFRGDSKRAWLSRVFLYELQDDARPGISKFGILRPDASPKPAYEAYRAFTTAASGGGTARLVPIVLDAFGKAGAHFSSELALANRGSSLATLTLTYTAADALGAGGSGVVAETLAPGRQLVIGDALSYLRTKGLRVPLASSSQAQGGTLRVRFEGLASADEGFAGARTTAPAGAGRAGLAYGAAPSEEGAASAVLVQGLRESAADRSNLALLNAGSAGTITLRVTLFEGDRTGRSAVLSPDVTLAPGQWTQLDSVLARAGYANGWARVDRVAGSEPFAAYGVVNDNVTNDGSYIAAVPAGRVALAQVIPAVVETPSFRTELVLTNPTAFEVSASLTYVESLAPGGGGTVVETLAPFEQRVIPDAIDHLRGGGASIGPKGGAYAGALSIAWRAAGAYAGARTSAPSPAGGEYGVFYSAVASSEAASEEAWVFGLVQNASSRSNVAFVNVGEEEISLRYEVWSGDTGEQLAAPEPFTLPPGGWKQVTRVLQPYGVSQGYVRAVRTAGDGRFVVYGVVNDGALPGSGTDDGSYVAMSVTR